MLPAIGNAIFCGDRRGRGAKTRGCLFFVGVFVGARATLCGDRRGRGAKTRGFFRICGARMNPLQGSAWSRCKNSSFFFWGLFFCGARATLCGDRRGRGAKTRRVFAFCCLRSGLWQLSRGLRGCSPSRAVAGSIPAWSAAALAAKSGMLSTKVVRGVHSRSSS